MCNQILSSKQNYETECSEQEAEDISLFGDLVL